MKLSQRYVFIFFSIVVGVALFGVSLTWFDSTRASWKILQPPQRSQKASRLDTVEPVKNNQGLVGGSGTAKEETPVGNDDKLIVPFKIIRPVTAEEFRRNPLLKTGNSLIDEYGKNNPHDLGENGTAVSLPTHLQRNVSWAMERFHVNVLASDRIPLNRLVPDSRFPKCLEKTYPKDLPTASVIIPFHDEWPSLLFRTIYSVINRTPRHLLWEIILVDDGSTMESLKKDLDVYIATHFPVDLVKIIRTEQRHGIVKARMTGVRQATGDVIVIFDSHMEVNVMWLEPLLTQIQSDPRSFAMGILDYIQAESFLYDWHKGYLTRYGFDWRLIFFETYFRPDQYGADDTVPKLGAVMVGAAFAVDRKFFLTLGGYDEDMNIWGGENLELSWRVWQCGGKLVHLPCSKLGHVARAQPYSFPGGRRNVEIHNYKRAVDVWMEPNHRKFVYNYFPEMESIDAGDLSARLELKQKLGCKDFNWFVDNVWPELTVFDRNVTAWGNVRNVGTDLCLDNHSFLFNYPEPLYADPCHSFLNTQGFALTYEGLLRSSLHCLKVPKIADKIRVELDDCYIRKPDTWLHSLKNEHIRHVPSGMCLDICDKVTPCLTECRNVITQMWTFSVYI